MTLGMIGLGRMGANMTERLVRGGHRVVGYDRTLEARERVEATGAESATSLAALVAAVEPPRALWLMVPAETIDPILSELQSLLAAGDTLIDGGNSNYQDTQRRARRLADQQIDYVDCGTSGGVWGLEEGYSLMVGGDAPVVDRLRPVFETLAPGAAQGWGRVGPVGAGHFTKMVHNGIEYGLMQAYAEGLSIMRHKSDFALDLHQVTDIWRHGSVVRSWLLDLTSSALDQNPRMEGIAPWVDDSGEGRWLVTEAIDLGVPAPVITLSLLARLRSRDPDSFSDKLLSSMRNRFGGHAIKKEQ